MTRVNSSDGPPGGFWNQLGEILKRDVSAAANAVAGARVVAKCADRAEETTEVRAKHDDRARTGPGTPGFAAEARDRLVQATIGGAMAGAARTQKHARHKAAHAAAEPAQPPRVADHVSPETKARELSAKLGQFTAEQRRQSVEIAYQRGPSGLVSFLPPLATAAPGGYELMMGTLRQVVGRGRVGVSPKDQQFFDEVTRLQGPGAQRVKRDLLALIDEKARRAEEQGERWAVKAWQRVRPQIEASLADEKVGRLIGDYHLQPEKVAQELGALGRSNPDALKERLTEIETHFLEGPLTGEADARFLRAVAGQPEAVELKARVALILERKAERTFHDLPNRWASVPYDITRKMAKLLEEPNVVEWLMDVDKGHQRDAVRAMVDKLVLTDQDLAASVIGKSVQELSTKAAAGYAQKPVAEGSQSRADMVGRLVGMAMHTMTHGDDPELAVSFAGKVLEHLGKAVWTTTKVGPVITELGEAVIELAAEFGKEAVIDSARGGAAAVARRFEMTMETLAETTFTSLAGPGHGGAMGDFSAAVSGGTVKEVGEYADLKRR